MMAIELKVPRVGKITKNGNTFTMEWKPDFAAKRTAQFNRKQAFIDSTVLQKCDPRVPFQTGMLKTSGKLGTVIGSGEVRYVAPYAAPQYYNTSDTRPYDGNRGAHWFERMKTAEGKDILEAAQKVK